jgi:hypothetical protein
MVHITYRHPLGFELLIDCASVEAADAMIRKLVQQGYTPGASNGGAIDWPKGPDGSPLCLKHNALMEKRERQGDVWYSHKIRDPQTGAELYCRGVRHHASPPERDGYLVDG